MTDTSGSTKQAEIAAYCALGSAAIDAKDHLQALEWYKLASTLDAKHLAVVYGTALCLEALGRAEESFAAYQDAAAICAIHWNEVGACYAQGWGTEKDEKKAIECYEKAADAGCVMAMVNIAQYLASGDGMKTDFSRARKLAEAVIEQLDGQHTNDMKTLRRARGKAWQLLGRLKENGNAGFEADDFAALECFQRAAEYKNAAGIFNWGLMVLKHATTHDERAFAMGKLLLGHELDPTYEPFLVHLEQIFRLARNSARAKEFADKLAALRAGNR